MDEFLYTDFKYPSAYHPGSAYNAVSLFFNEHDYPNQFNCTKLIFFVKVIENIPSSVKFNYLSASA